MSDIIQILPDSVANQIAAGEVIQRPASVIKELVENAVDAGATAIEVMVIDAGRTSIQVIDNGKGMSATDARLSFERHATSKISQASDLFNLTTMGFRGEALASIAAVAQVSLKTRREEDELGSELLIAGSRFVSQQPCSCPVGSNFNVQNLFYNVPARRKFLKSNATELNNILTAFERIALVYPSINFTLHSNNTEIYNLRSGSLRQRIVDVIGKRINQDLLPLNVSTTMCNISGFVGKPEAAKKKGAPQYFFVNGRYMKHPYFARAVATAMERLVPVGEQVPFFIYFDVNPEDLDVNIHPTKTEIKFENEQAIWQILMAAVKDAVGLFSSVTALDFDSEEKPDIPVFSNETGNVQAPKVDFNADYNPFNAAKKQSQPYVSRKWEDLYKGVKNHGGDQQTLFGTDEMAAADSLQESPSAQEGTPAHYQFKSQYIITSVKSGLMIMDQHRAHVRILYEEFMEHLTNASGASQRMLYPEVIQFQPSQAVMFQKLEDELVSVGFDFSNLGGNSYAINAIPVELEGSKVGEMIVDLCSSVSSSETSVMSEVHHKMALKMATCAAVSRGQQLNNAQMDSIINRLFACSNTNYTPDGKLIVSILQQSDLDELFG